MRTVPGILPTLCVSLCLLASCRSAPPGPVAADAEPPSWFLGLELPEGIIAGYGEGSTLEEARQRALGSLASQVEVRVDVDAVLTESGDEASSAQSFEREISAQSDAVFTGVMRLREERLGGVYYSAYGWDTRSLRSRALAAGRGNSSPLPAGGLKSRLPIADFLRKNGAASNFRLEYENGAWHLAMGSVSIPVGTDELARDFFPLVNSDNLELVPGLKNELTVPVLLPNHLEDGQLFLLRYRAQTDGFLSLFYVDGRGAVQSLLENRRVSPGERIEYPDARRFRGLRAETGAAPGPSADMILAVEAPERHYHGMQAVPAGGVPDEDAGLYRYGALLEGPEGTHFSTIVVHIRPGRNP